jgi:hypothetical protein
MVLILEGLLCVLLTKQAVAYCYYVLVYNSFINEFEPYYFNYRVY